MVDPIADGIIAHAWNADRSRVAIAPNTNDIFIYKVVGDDSSKWELEFTLSDHDKLVTSIAWAPKTNRILSCSQDRNAYVWNFVDGQWKPTLVLLTITRAATCCAWSCDETKFAVGSSAKILSVCYFEEANDWWVSKQIKKFKSTILSISWHPTNPTILATASSDFKCKVFSAYVKEIDRKEDSKGILGKDLNEFSAAGWVEDVAWSPSGSQLAFASHDSSLTVASIDSGAVSTIKTRYLPFRSVIWLSENAIVAGGHTFSPIAFSKKGDAWTCNGEIDLGDAAKKTTGGAFGKAMAQFESKTKDSDEINTQHKNAISSLRVVGEAGGKVSKFSSAGIDGRVVMWNVSNIKAAGFAL